VFRLEGAWFDWTRRVQTSREVDLDKLTLVGNPKDAYRYLPVRPSVARRVLRDLPVRDPERYTFVDMGSGKGRMLLIAAEYPFRQIQGVEFAVELHRRAYENIQRYRSPKQKCVRIRSLAINVVDYTFPNDNLVIYFFNPFGRELMQQVVNRLDKSLQDHPRDIIVVMLYPDFSFVLGACPRFSLVRETRRYRIYRTVG
jgi:predicted RNA methylase